MTTPVRSYPATFADLLTMRVPPAVAEAWHNTWSSPFAGDYLKTMRPEVLECDDGRLGAIGVNLVYPFGPGQPIPWVWFVKDAQAPASSLRDAIRFGRAWLDQNARGAFTSAEPMFSTAPTENTVYVRLLRVLGFKDHGNGVWQWPS